MVKNAEDSRTWRVVGRDGKPVSELVENGAGVFVDNAFSTFRDAYAVIRRARALGEWFAVTK